MEQVEIERRVPRLLSCPICGAPALHWSMVGSDIMLVHSDGTVHICKSERRAH
jgi:hypothetical protein